VATDADPLSVGLFRADAAFILPSVKEDEAAYQRRLIEICLSERVKLVAFGSEIEMRRMAPRVREIERATQARLVVNEAFLLESFMDKWTTFELLRKKGLPVADTALASDPEAVREFLARHQFPIILKPRHGSGSKGLVLLKDAEEMDWYLKHVNEPVLQEHLLPDDEEYTVGLYRSRRAGFVGQIVFRRSLAAGLTYKAEVVFDPEIEEVCRRLMEAFDLWGPVNVQLRKTARGVRIFEVNCRFSSSAVMRAYFGFNEADLCMRDLLSEGKIPSPRIRRGFSLRYWDEVYVGGEDYARLRTTGRLDRPRGEILEDF
jgi:carbamoyl-phosphate synthase large subunit